MGAIQQAFNQALSIGAIAMGPMIAQKKQANTEKERLEKSQEKLQKQIDIEAEAAEASLKEVSKKPPKEEGGKITRGKSSETQLETRKNITDLAYKKFE